MIKGNLLKITVFIFLIFGAFQGNATHIAGSDMTYERIDSLTYKLTLTIYRYCGCSSANLGGSVSILIDAPGFGSTTVTASRQAIVDVNPTCGTATPVCSGGCGKGIEAHVFEGTIDLDQAPYQSWFTGGACKVYFSWTSCCRNSNITTGLNDKSFYTYCMIDVCVSENNSSPQFSSPPASFICCNTKASLALGGQDYIDFDSLSYHLTAPLGTSRTNNLYPNAPLSVGTPITPYCPGGVPCAAIPNATPPIGFSFDNSTGQTIFNPTECGEIGVMAFEIEEWRKVGGVMKLAGSVRRDVQVWVENCSSNNPPDLKSTDGNVITVNKALCESICFEITTSDIPIVPPPPLPAQQPDTTLLKVQNLPPGATFTITNPTERLKKGVFCWNIPDTLPDNFITQVVFIVQDDECPKPAESQLIVTIKLDSSKQSGKVQGYVKIDTSNNCKADSAEPGVFRHILSGKTNSIKAQTSKNGFYSFCTDDDTSFVKLLPSPFFIDSCQGDTFVKINKSVKHNINFSTTYKNGLHGNVIEDYNNNCVNDSSDIGMNKPILIVAQPGNITTTTDAFGQYYLPFKTHQNYTIYVTDSGDFANGCNVSFTHNYAKDSTYFAKDVFLYGTKQDFVRAYPIGRTNTVLGFQSREYIQILNLDTFNYGKTYATLLLDSNITVDSIKANTGSVTSLGGGVYKFIFDSLTKSTSVPIIANGIQLWGNKLYKKEQFITIYYKADTPYFKLDSSFAYQFYIDSLTKYQSYTRYNDTIKKRINIVASYDPNTKTTYQNKTITPVNTRIDYQIQFQNTGTATAVNIEVRDTLPPYLNYSTFQLFNSSHKVRPLLNNHLLSFAFDDINLPDSATSPEESIATVNFSFYAYDTMKYDVDLFNSASIYFDVQEPVKTNTSHINYHSPTEVNQLERKVFCEADSIKVPFTSFYEMEFADHKYYLELLEVGNIPTGNILMDSLVSINRQDTFEVILPSSVSSGSYQFKVSGSPTKAQPFVPYYSDTFEYKTSPKLAMLNPETVCEKDTINVFTDLGFSNYKFYKSLNKETDNGTNNTFIFQTAFGDSVIHAIVTYKNSCQLFTDTLSIITKPKIVANFAVLDSVKCSLPSSFEISNKSIDQPLSKYYVWSNGVLQDSALSASTPLYVKPTSIGEHQVLLIASVNNRCGDTMSKTIFVGVKPTSSISLNEDTLCGNQPVNARDLSTANGSEIGSTKWLWGDGNTSNNIKNAQHLYTNFGIYTISLIAQDSFGCADTASVSAKIIDAPTADFNFTLDSCFNSNRINMNATSDFKGVNVFSETLFFGDNNSSNASSATNNYANSGTYKLTAIAINEYLCADTALADIQIHPNPDVFINQNIIDSCLNTNLIELYATGSNFDLASWDLNDGTNLTGNNIKHNYLADGIYNIQLFAANNYNCWDTANSSVTILPGVGVVASAKNICEYDVLTFEIDTLQSKINNFSYNINFNSDVLGGNFPTDKTLVINAPLVGNYLSSIVADGGNGCFDTFTFAHQVFAKPMADFEAKEQEGEVVIINLNTLSKNNWDFGNGDSNVVNNQTTFSYVYNSKGEFIITLKVFDNNDCYDTAQRNVSLLDGIKFFIPSAYSPNKDGKNDEFTISGTNQIKTFNFKLYNRWGQQIYESNEPTKLLDGTEFMDGNYVYIIYIQDIKGRKHNIKGELYILR